MNRLATTLAITALAALAPQTASACGGFFCNNSAPVDQSAERIVFAVDADTGMVESHVQIFYQGPSEDFAWVVPTPTEPELFLSSDALFNTLDGFTRPYFWLEWSELGNCSSGGGGIIGNRGGWGDEADFDVAEDSGGDDGVTVVNQAQVGPYDTVVLQATSEDLLIEWLQDNSYDIPETMSPALAPYVASNQYFIALKLVKDRDNGDISPIGFRYAGTEPMIPIQLTSVAATPDMRLEVYVFGEERAVPSNYLHVQVNEAAIDWVSGGANYDDVITLAADEAGGHAFATDFAGSPSMMQGSLWSPGRYDTASIAGMTDAAQIMNTIIGQGFPASASLLNILTAHMPPPSGVEAADYYNCVECFDNNDPVDGAALAADLDEYLVAPLEAAEGLFSGYSKVSRMTSSISPAEMTIDPMFVQNATMADVSNEHQAEIIYDCRNGRDWWTAPRRIVLQDRRVILLPSEEWVSDSGTTTADFLAEGTEVNALIIEQTSASGEPTVLSDNTELANANLDDHNDRVAQLEGLGCGCSSSGGPVGGLLLLPLLAGIVRRRQG